MSDLRNFDLREAVEDYNHFEMLVNTKEYVTKDEYNFITNWDTTEKSNFTYVDSYLGDYLNLNLYSEHDHEKYDGDDVNNLTIS
tara:strand:+ start:1902 stop:2153 length:252 start_codon:yes stop_codon:yes gene_type:complete